MQGNIRVKSFWKLTYYESYIVIQPLNPVIWKCILTLYSTTEQEKTSQILNFNFHHICKFHRRVFQNFLIFLLAEDKLLSKLKNIGERICFNS